MSFHTESSARKSQLVILCVFIIFALLSLFGLKIALITCLFFEGMTLLCFIICFVLVSKTRWLLDFQDNVLILTNTANHKQYRLDDLTVSDFHLKQTAVQMKANRCDLTLANLPFRLYDVKNYDISVTKNNDSPIFVKMAIIFHERNLICLPNQVSFN